MLRTGRELTGEPAPWTTRQVRWITAIDRYAMSRAVYAQSNFSTTLSEWSWVTVTPSEDINVRESTAYWAPMIERLGTLAELTLGGGLPDMGDGFAGASDTVLFSA